MLIPLDTIQAAHTRLSPYLTPSPLHPARAYNQRLNTNIHMKLEFLLPTNAFKVRGALNALLCLDADALSRGVVTASAGNHGLGVSYAAKVVGTSAVVVLPLSAPKARADAIKRQGGEVIMHGEDWNEANVHALYLAKARELTYISAFDDEAIMAGQGTIALELLTQCPQVTHVVCSVGGGGLISGIASAIKQLRPDVHVYGVETLGADCMSASLRAGHIVELPRFTSIATSLGTKRTGERQFQIVQEAVTDVVVVSDEAALDEVLFTLDNEKFLIEPAASCTFAALAQQLIPHDETSTIVPIMCGANLKLEHVLAWQQQFAVRS